jgi:hypothetical protein
MFSIPPPGTHQKSRPSSAKGRSAFAPSTVNIGAQPSKIGATGPTSPATVGHTASIEATLVANLKEQVKCLELEVEYLKQGKSAAPTSSSPTYGYSVPQPQPQPAVTFANVSVQQPPQQPQSAPSQFVLSNSADFRTTHAELLNHAATLEKEVKDLRKKYADREKEHQLELAHARAGTEIIGVTTAQGATANVRQELHEVREIAKRDIATLKEAHAQEVVTLQKTVERLNLEYQTHYNELQAAIKERDALLKDLSLHKEELRGTRGALETLKRQYDEAHRMLSAEQEQRRKLETVEKDLRVLVSSGQQELTNELQRKVNAMEVRCAEQAKTTSIVTYENEQLKLQLKKSQDDIAALVAERGQLNEHIEQLKFQVKESTHKLDAMNNATADLISERDYFRLQVDRLKVDHSILEVKSAQLESRSESDKTAYLNLERQYCQALETIDALKREGKVKEKLYEQLDQNDSKLRKANFVLSEELTSVRHTVDDLKAALMELSAKYEANRNLAEQARAEQHLAMTLTKLDKMKHELQNLLGTQLRISQDLSQTMLEVPDSSAVLKAITPHHPGLNLVNQSGIGLVGHDTSLVAGGNTPRQPTQPPAAAPIATAVAPLAVQLPSHPQAPAPAGSELPAASSNLPTPSSVVVTQTPTH